VTETLADLIFRQCCLLLNFSTCTRQMLQQSDITSACTQYIWFSCKSVHSTLQTSYFSSFGSA